MIENISNRRPFLILTTNGSSASSLVDLYMLIRNGSITVRWL